MNSRQGVLACYPLSKNESSSDNEWGAVKDGSLISGSISSRRGAFAYVQTAETAGEQNGFSIESNQTRES
jgi:hypothetical protein